MEVRRESDNQITSSITMSEICDLWSVIWHNIGTAIPASASVYTPCSARVPCTTHGKGSDNSRRATLHIIPFPYLCYIAANLSGYSRAFVESQLACLGQECRLLSSLLDRTLLGGHLDIDNCVKISLLSASIKKGAASCGIVYGLGSQRMLCRNVFRDTILCVD
jgi:hypothetical protein